MVKTIQQLAEELNNALTHDKRNDAQEFVHLKDGSPSWMTDVVRSVHGDKLPDDTVYRFIERCAEAIANSDAQEGPIETIVAIESDHYIQALNAWIQARA